jgi:hypothetical protein
VIYFTVAGFILGSAVLRPRSLVGIPLTFGDWIKAGS